MWKLAILTLMFLVPSFEGSKWVSVNKFSALPADAVRVGREKNGESVYVGRYKVEISFLMIKFFLVSLLHYDHINYIKPKSNHEPFIFQA